MGCLLHARCRGARLAYLARCTYPTPNTIGRAPGGLSYYDVLDLILAVAERGRIAAADFVEIMPEVDVDGIGGLTVSRLVAATMGIIARQQSVQS